MIRGRGTSLRQADSLVAIQSAGSKPPLFFVHAYGGGVFFYRELADSLGTDQPFYGLQAAGLDGKRRPHARVVDMAAHYIGEIKKVQPKGPYYIGGRCLGAYVAFEMANQLHAQGERIALLSILDSYWAPQADLPVRQRSMHPLEEPYEGKPQGEVCILLEARGLSNDQN